MEITPLSPRVLDALEFLSEGLSATSNWRDRPIDYIDPAPQPFEVQIPLVEYFERIKRHKADRWQHDFCRRLQEAAENRHIKGAMLEFHAEPRLGKTSLLSQTFPAWLFGHDPLFRYALAMYNITQSQSHSDVIIQIMRSQIHKDIFPNRDGWLPASVSKAGWMTNARRDIEKGIVDGQKSLNPVGLESGLTGGGMDWLTIDDPYKDPKEAFSETMWTNLDRFWRFGVLSRLSPHSCVASMFHRYSETDFGGYLLDTGDFEYVRYATVLEKPEDLVYIHEATGQRFEDPLGRGVGEYISERRDESYYRKNKADKKVWNSMFIGVPRTEDTDFFHVNKIEIITDEDEALREWNLCIAQGRGWDNAATSGAGDFSASALAGIQADGTLVFGDATMDQLDTGARMDLQQELAMQDGRGVAICVPKDKAAAGKDVVYFTTQALQDYIVVPREVTNAAPGSDAKARRAYNLSTLVNTRKVKFLYLKRKNQPADYVPGAWIKAMQRAMTGFLQGGNDDIIDAAGDVTNYLYETLTKGLVIKQLTLANLKPREEIGKIPAKWTVYAGVKITPEASRPNSAVIVARPSEHAKLPDHLFVVAEYKRYTDDFASLFAWIDGALKEYCEKPDTTTIWLHKESEAFIPVIKQKLKYGVQIFKEDASAGISEMNWYIDGRLFGLIDQTQLTVASDEDGLINLRQEASTWGYNDKGEPNQIGAVADCLRMVSYRFKTISKGMTMEERVHAAIPESAVQMLTDAKTANEKLVAQMTYEFERDFAEQKVNPDAATDWIE